jgi:ankyrin repeat protein
MIIYFRSGADVSRSTDSNDATVLSLACAGGHLDLASILLKHGANPNHLLKVNNDESIRHLCIQYCIFHCCCCFRLNFQDHSNCLIEAAKSGHTSIVQLLLEYHKGLVQRATHTSDNHQTLEILHDHDDVNHDTMSTTSMSQSFPLASTTLSRFTCFYCSNDISPMNFN